MATFESKEIIDEMIAGDGSYQGDPPPVAIYEYRNPIVDKTLYCVAYVESDIFALYQSPHVIQESIKELWPCAE
jgi:hypothetical protein